MYSKLLSIAALTASASAQMMNLTAALGSSPDLSSLTSLVSTSPQLLASLSMASNITILAPSNDAFAKITNTTTGNAVMMNQTSVIEALLSYHVLNGSYSAAQIMEMPAFVPTMLMDPMFANVTGGQRVEAVKLMDSVTFFSGLGANSTVTTADTNFTGGVIHIIDSVLTIPANISTTLVAAGLSGVAGLIGQSEGLGTTLDSMSRDLTVFAPNNAALQNIGTALPNLTTQQIASILQYHVVNASSVGYSSTLMNGTMLETLNGNNLTITIDGMNVFVNSAKVIQPDILVANGVVHIIDNVLNPNMTMATPMPTASTQSAVFSGASSASDLPFTSGVPTATSSIGGGLAGASSMMQASGMASSTSTGGGAAMPMKTGAIGAAALFAGANVWLNV